jgi:sugar (pentulose or hexulose) kinase
MASLEQKESTLKLAKKVLFIPDIFNYFLTGVMKNEYTEASTSQLLNAREKVWDAELMEKLNIPAELFCDIIMPGEVVGELSDEICEELGCPKLPVIAVGSHDTASAVASVPVTGEYDYAYISSGTWALMGSELDAPTINDRAFSYNFTNEGGVCDKIRFLKNIMGLWIIQESRRQWEREGKEFTFDDLENAAWNAEPFRSFIDPDYHEFATPGNMPKKIRGFCESTGQEIPQSEGEIIRCAAQSLALKCNMVANALEDVQGKKIEVIHMVGGGIKDAMVCQFIASATGRKVIAGPVEATSTGNAVVQLMALGKIRTLKEARAIIKNSFPIKIYEPCDREKWSEAYERFQKVAKI